MAKQFQAICRYTTDQIEIKFSGPIHYGLPQAWLTFDHDPRNSHCLLASDQLSSFSAFADKMLIGFSSYLEGQFIMGLPQLD